MNRTATSFASAFAFCAFVFVALAPRSVRAAETLDAKAVAQIDAMAQPLIDGQYAVGFVVGTLQDGHEWTKGYGAFEKGKPGAPDADTLFEIGSVSKVFTGLLLSDAIERGLVTLDEPIQKLLPDGVKINEIDDDDPIRLVHLTTHSSGLPRMPDNWKPANADDPYSDYDVEKMFAFLPHFRATRSPGEAYEYSNYGVGLLGQLMVRVNKAKNYEALLKDRITAPLGLGDTLIAMPKEKEARFTPSYDASCEPNSHWNLDAFAGAGAIRSTVHDMLKFTKAQIDPSGTPLAQAIPPTHVAHYHKQKPGEPDVALGWHCGDPGCFWHNGQVGGHHAFVAVSPEKKIAAVVLCNSACGQIDQVGDSIFVMLMTGTAKPVTIKQPIAVDRAVLERYVGTYKMNLMRKFTVKLEDDGLTAQITGQSAYRIYPESPTRFAFRVVDATIDFEVGADGKPTALVLHQNGQDIRSEKE